MSLKHVMFCSQKDAEKKASWGDWAVISVTSSCTYPANLKNGWWNVLRLEFDDIDIHEDPYQMFNEKHAREIIAFVRRCHESGGECTGILVHCTAGISRSAAIVMWISDRYRLPFTLGYSLYNKLVYQILREEHMLTGFENDVD